jgi:hypothetical protein
MNRELKEFRRLERMCLEHAELATLDLARSGLLKVADDCRLAAEALEAKSPARFAAIVGAMHALKLSLSHPRADGPR